MSAEPTAEAIHPTGRGTELVVANDRARTLDWVEAQQRLNEDRWCWLSTVRPDGAPHVMPVLAVWADSAVFVSSNDAARKSRNMAADGRCVVTTDASETHLVVEGHAVRTREHADLERASRAFEEVYGWPTWIQGDTLDADYGAPTSGGPPYGVYRITPTKAFAFPADGMFVPTRWRFSATSRTGEV